MLNRKPSIIIVVIILFIIISVSCTESFFLRREQFPPKSYKMLITQRVHPISSKQEFICKMVYYNEFSFSVYGIKLLSKQKGHGCYYDTIYIGTHIITDMNGAVFDSITDYMWNTIDTVKTCYMMDGKNTTIELKKKHECKKIRIYGCKDDSVDMLIELVNHYCSRKNKPVLQKTGD